MAIRRSFLAKGLRALTHFVHFFMQRFATAIDVARARAWRNGKPIRERLTGTVDIASASRVAVFANFEPHGRLCDYVRFHVEQLVGAGYAVVFCCNSPHMTDEAREFLLARCAVVLHRKNIGGDFGAFKDGLREIPDVGRLASLILANDSVFGPLQPLPHILADMDAEKADVWGITDSWERHHHLQSYFLVFSSRALSSEAFRGFWEHVDYLRSKWAIVHLYEIGMTQALEAAGLRCRALHPQAEVVSEACRAWFRHGSRIDEIGPAERRYRLRVLRAARRGVALNTTHFFWDHLLTERRAPFVKRALLLKNPMEVPSVDHWEAVIRRVSNYDVGMIRSCTNGGAAL
ncbi:MAG: rhamnan synthesis F family protein [Pseudomonadota bacterium]